MSVTLNRREFVAGAAALLVAPPAAAADIPSFSFALITDTHLGKPGADYVKRMATAVRLENVIRLCCPDAFSSRPKSFASSS